MLVVLLIKKIILISHILMFIIVFFRGLKPHGDILSSGKMFDTYMWREFDYCVNSRSSIPRRECAYIFWLIQFANREVF